ncbi:MULTISPECIES: enoyl-CoA hydratase-related protein [unclassified Streptomyces]|uniref:enoyl-CoA hydratase-related protein n=1 Tax=unclassified Streptomyces TaxID=2593676 RepID=UPI003324602A
MAATSGGPDDSSLGTVFRRLGEARPATIKVLEGRARGAGAELPYACDMRFASAEQAVIGRPEAGTGVFPGAGAVQQLARLAGRGQAMQVIPGLRRTAALMQRGLQGRSRTEFEYGRVLGEL